MSEFKYQYSQFSPDKIAQFVVRTDDKEEFKQMVSDVKKALGNSVSNAPVKQNSAITGEKRKVPYMWAGDVCPECHKGILVEGWNKTKDGEKYKALMCDQNGCYGKAYVSKYPKPNQDNYPQEEQNNDIPF